jgi:thymidylate synthase
MSKFEKDYKKILSECLNKGIKRNDRTKIGSYSIFNKSLSINISKKFPILTGRKIYPKVFNAEFEWFINGETNIKRFQNNNIKIWDAWADENGNLGPVYGHQMINFNDSNINQLENVIDSLNNNKDSRRHIISLWNPIQTNQMALPPCYLYFQFFVNKDKLNMFVVQRSGDLFLGIPYDIALFSKILLYISEQTNLKANIIDLQIVDAHIYKNQINSVIEYLKQPINKLPKYKYNNKKLVIEEYISGPVITCEVAV